MRVFRASLAPHSFLREHIMTYEEHLEKARTRLPDDYHLNVLQAECIGCVEINNIRNIVWLLGRQKYLQECLADKSVFYLVPSYIKDANGR